MPISPTYLHKRGHYNILPAGDFLRLAPGRGLRGIGPAFAGNVGTGVAFALSEAGTRGWCLGEGSAGSVLRTLGSLGKDGAFALCARGGFDRFQCLLRPGPAAARCEVGACRASTLKRLFPNSTKQGQEVAVEDTVDVDL